MDESERLERYKEHRFDLEWAQEVDEELAERIAALINHSQINKYCMVDAHYYDFSVIPRGIQERLQLWRDAYLIYGITTEGEIVSKWVDRWDLDSDDPIVEGKVIHSDKPTNIIVPADINVKYDPNLLSNPVPDLIHKMFEGFK